jgi:hypothetical protein
MSNVMKRPLQMAPSLESDLHPVCGLRHLTAAGVPYHSIEHSGVTRAGYGKPPIEAIEFQHSLFRLGAKQFSLSSETKLSS